MIKTAVFAKGERGLRCLTAMAAAGYLPTAVLAESGDAGVTSWASSQGVRLMADPKDLLQADLDVLVLAGYTRILREPLLSHARLGTLNLHGGKLPEYRGASVINWQIINGEIEGGVSVIFADEGIDTGDIAAEARYPILPSDTIREVTEKTLALFPKLLVEVLRAVESGTAVRKKQSLRDGCYYHKRMPEDGCIRWRAMTAEGVHNLVRALTAPLPGAFAFLDGKKVSIWATRVLDENFRGLPGRVVRHFPDGFVVMAADRGILLTDFSVEGLDRSGAEEFFKRRVGRDFKEAV